MRSPARQRYLDRLYAAFLSGVLPDPREGGGEPILEVACGSGGLSARLAAAGWRLVACDLATPQDAASDCSYCRADVRRLPFPDGTFRTVLAVHMLDTLAREGALEAALEEMRRVLAPGGGWILIEDRRARVPLDRIQRRAEALGLRLRETERLRGKKGLLHAAVSRRWVRERWQETTAAWELRVARLRPDGPGAYAWRFFLDF